MKTTTKNFTTTLPTSTLIFLEKMSQDQKRPKNKILEEALKLWKQDLIRQKIKQSYAKAKKDPEWNDLGNIGFQDTLSLLP